MAKPRARKPKEPVRAPGEPPVDRPAGPSVAIAFGGGGARGLAHIHIISALDELGIRPKLIAGSSIGAIVGAGYAAGMSGSDIADYARSTLGNRAEVMARIWKSRPGTLGELMSAGFRVTQFNIERILRSFLPPVLPQTFDGLKVPLLVTGTDFYANAVTVFDSGDLISAVAASAALPAIFKPVRRDGRIYLDGGLDKAAGFILRVWEKRAQRVLRAMRDPKTMLQEWLAQQNSARPVYAIVGREGPDHEPIFTVEVQAPGFSPSLGRGRSRQAAEQAAAAAFLAREGVATEAEQAA